MLSAYTVNRLSDLQINARSANDFASGIKLTELYIKLFHNGELPELYSKMITKYPYKNGNRIININILVKHMRADTRLSEDRYLTEISKFKLIEEQSEIKKFVEWMIRKASYINHSEKEYVEADVGNELYNLYFAADIERVSNEEFNDSLDRGQEAESVGRKGSFKVLRPRVISQECLVQPQQEDLKELSMIGHTHNTHVTMTKTPSEEEQYCRKTVPKMIHKPPIYRSKQKENQEYYSSREKYSSHEHCGDKLQADKYISKCSPYVGLQSSSMSGRATDRKEDLRRSVAALDEEINIELAQKYPAKPKLRTNSSSRKIFKVDIPYTSKAVKANIVEWLIGINLLSTKAINYYDNLHDVCKNGVIFSEVVSYYRGRGTDLCSFKEPKRSAELYSNYQKVFTALKEVPNFCSNLLFLYYYFVPEVQEKAFWSFLSSMYYAYHKKARTTYRTNIEDYDNQIKKKLTRAMSSKTPTKAYQIEYQKVKFGGTVPQKICVSMPLKDVLKEACITPMPPRSIKQHYHSDLVQNYEPNYNKAGDRGYKDLYLSKFKNVDTPKKLATPKKCTLNSSLNRSRMASMYSLRKQEVKPSLPSINLEMQMQATKYIGGLAYEINLQETNELFKDPYRNGVLLNHVVCKEFGLNQHGFIRSPKSIDDCRGNVNKALTAIKSRVATFSNSYLYYSYYIIKGERSLVYGAIWHILTYKNGPFEYINVYKFDDNSLQNTRKQPYLYNLDEEFLLWIRHLEKSSQEIAELKIRDKSALVTHLVEGSFLFIFSELVTNCKKAISPTYDKPATVVQREANLKKAISYLVQNKAIRSDHLWRTKQLAKRDIKYIRELLIDLMSSYRHTKKDEGQYVTFVKYVKRNTSCALSKDRLDTTMANQTFNQQQPITVYLEVPWMRKLGFKEDLSLSSGVILCRLVSKLIMKTIPGIIEQPQSKAECLSNIRKALKEMPKTKWDYTDILEADRSRTLYIYSFLKEKYKHAYAMKFT